MKLYGYKANFFQGLIYVFTYIINYLQKVIENRYLSNINLVYLKYKFNIILILLYDSKFIIFYFMQPIIIMTNLFLSYIISFYKSMHIKE